jgi:glycine cleavage system pyridoxal-binding protein P
MYGAGVVFKLFALIQRTPALQALLANIAAMYAVYHGPSGLKRIASKVHRSTLWLGQRKKVVYLACATV